MPGFSFKLWIWRRVRLCSQTFQVLSGFSGCAPSSSYKTLDGSVNRRGGSIIYTILYGRRLLSRAPKYCIEISAWGGSSKAVVSTTSCTHSGLKKTFWSWENINLLGPFDLLSRYLAICRGCKLIAFKRRPTLPSEYSFRLILTSEKGNGNV